jgi:hypothetical protein
VLGGTVNGQERSPVAEVVALQTVVPPADQVIVSVEFPANPVADTVTGVPLRPDVGFATSCGVTVNAALAVMVSCAKKAWGPNVVGGRV